MIIDGKKEAQLLRNEIKKEIESIKSKNNKVPGLTVILIGDFAPSQIYVKNKEKNAKEVGINSEVVRYSKEVTEQEVLNKIKELNDNDAVSGILVQLPLPPQINKEKIINAIESIYCELAATLPVNLGGAYGSKYKTMTAEIFCRSEEITPGVNECCIDIPLSIGSRPDGTYGPTIWEYP